MMIDRSLERKSDIQFNYQIFKIFEVSTVELM